jgi:MscS family membrane protein
MEFLDNTSFGVVNYKWIGIIAALFAGWAFRPLLQLIIRNLKKLSQKFHAAPDSFFSQLLSLNIEKPLASLIIGVFWLAAIDSLEFPAKFAKYFELLAKLWIVLNLIFLCYRMVDALGFLMSRWAKRSESTADDQLVPFAKKALKVVVIILGVLVFMQNVGINVAALLAGLSLGGVALALAAQDTFANLFGSITIFFDNPFKVGDHIKVGGAEGVVEEIGFRSTRIRSFVSTLITIPNSIVAKEVIDNWGVRQSRRIRFVLNLHYDTPQASIEQFCDTLKYYLKNDPNVVPGSDVVSFTTLGASSLDVLVQYFIHVKEYQQELDQVKKLNYEILSSAKKLNIEFAYPTQTIYHKPLLPS